MMKFTLICLLLGPIAYVLADSYSSINDKIDQHVVKVLKSNRVQLDDETVDALYQEFKAVKGVKGYQETPHQKSNFRKNINNIFANNNDFVEGKVTSKMAVNDFADMTIEEIKQMLHGARVPESALARNQSDIIMPKHDCNEDNSISGEKFSWVDQGIVWNIKNQGSCGSCYAFSAVAVLEAMYKKKYGQQRTFSEQQLVDCTQSYGNLGCGGGWMNDCYKFINQNSISSEASYPYTGRVGQCRRGDVALKINGYVDIRKGDDNDLMRKLKEQGPIAIAMDVGMQEFSYYKSGVIQNPSCDRVHVTHAMTLVGYGTENINGQAIPYWLIKNSWGTQWGANGYVKMSRKIPNYCGISNYASYPTF